MGPCGDSHPQEVALAVVPPHLAAVIHLVQGPAELLDFFSGRARELT